MRWILVATLCAVVTSGCGGERGSFDVRDLLKDDDGSIEYGQTVTLPPPEDPIFIDFEKNWRQFIAVSEALALPVFQRDDPEEEPWEPLYFAKCVFSADAGADVPRVTLIWNEPVGSDPEIDIDDVSPPGDPGVVVPPDAVAPGAIAATGDGGAGTPRATAVPQRDAVISRSDPGRSMTPQDQVDDPPPRDPKDAPPRDVFRGDRIDLSLQYQGFKRNYFSSNLTTTVQKRFSLPPDSALITDTEAVLLVGPALFPRLSSYGEQILTDRDTRQQFRRRTLVLTDLSDGLSYRIRLSRQGQDGWVEEHQYVFLTPVCLNSF